MANYPVKLLKDKDGTAFIPVVNSDSIITPEGDTLNDLLEEKQDLLTSGTNIKTINNESLLGSGNISIQGGGTVTSVKINATSPIAIDNNAAITTSGERTISHANSGVTAGTYKSVTVDSKGHVTAGTNPTTLSGYGITDAKISKNGTITLGSNTITPSTIQNIKDGSATGSVRTSNSATESTTYTIGPNAFSEGSSTRASGNASHAEGGYTKAFGTNSHAEGYWARAVGKNSHAEGGWDPNVPYNIIGTVVSIDTENKTYEVSGLTRYNNKNYVGAMYYNSSNGSSDSYYITSETYDTTTNNFTFGVSSIDSSIEVGGSFYIKISSVALGDFSHSEGINTFAPGKCSHAEGWNTIARYNGSHAEGSNTYAGPFAHAEGYYTEASGYYGAHAEGNYTKASGNSSHTEGSYTKASGNYSHAEGSYTEASGSSSHASGYYTKANRSYQTVVGKYNDSSSTALFVVGNGTADDARSNAFEVYSDGRAELGADPTTAMGVATKQYVDTKDGDLTNLTTTTKTDLVSAINEVNETNIITAVGADQSITTNTDSKYTNIVFNSTLASLGNKLSLNTTTGAITIGNGINYVKVSCGCYINMNSSGTYHRLVILKNGTQYGKTSQTKGQYSPSTYGTLCLSNILIPVAQGDIISAQTFCRIAGSYTVGEPYISVEAVG